MRIKLSPKAVTLLLAILMIFLLTYAIWTGTAREFQLDSEMLVISAMYRARNAKDAIPYGLSSISNDGLSLVEKFSILVSNDLSSTPVLGVYKSQIGLQGFVFSFLCRCVPGISLRVLVYFFRILCVLAMAITLSLIVILLARKYNTVFAAAFFLTVAFSPWIRNFSPNLYWVSFTWFIPMLLGLWLSVDYAKHNRWWMYLLIFASVFIKCACGYEYISSIMMGLIMFPLVDLITGMNAKRKTLFVIIFKMGVVALLGFATAISIHGLISGNGDLFSGLSAIWKEDVLRRTLGGNASDFPAVYADSLNASVFDTLEKYFTFETDVLIGIGKQYFVPLILLSTGILIARTVCKKDNLWEFVFAVVAFLTTISWFVLGKSHSYIHTHMNFVLWYFGYIQVCVYSILVSISSLIKQLVRK